METILKIQNLLVNKAYAAILGSTLSDRLGDLEGGTITDTPEFIDAFVSSCYVGLRKPDPDIFRLALNIAQVLPEQVVYIENTPMFVRVAEDLRINGICHTDYNSTRKQLAAYGLEVVS